MEKKKDNSVTDLRSALLYIQVNNEQPISDFVCECKVFFQKLKKRGTQPSDAATSSEELRFGSRSVSAAGLSNAAAE